MANFNISTTIGDCNSFWVQAINQKGIVENPDGTISVYLKNSNNVVTPFEVTKICCDVLESITKKGYFFDLNAQKCRYSLQSKLDCGFDKPFKVVLNPVGNDGAIFNINDKEVASLTIDFDYLFKFDCTSLSQKISQVKPINPQIAIDIKAIENQIITQTAVCEEIASRLAYNENKFNNAKYSFFCDLLASSNQTVSGTTLPPNSTVTLHPIFSGITIPVRPPARPPVDYFLAPLDLSSILNPNLPTNNTFVGNRTPISDLFVPTINRNLLTDLVFQAVATGTTTVPVFPRIPIITVPKQPVLGTPTRPILISPTFGDKQIIPFTRSGFGTNGLAPFSFPNATIANTTNGNFCILEPEGLVEWESILGADRFNRFINGDETSYTCRDASQMYYNTKTTQLIITCDTPFGEKTKIQKTIDSIKIEQQNCQAILDDLNTKLQALINTNTVDNDICGTPISVLENLSVVATLEVLENGKLNTVQEYELFNTIGTGNLYNYLVSKQDSSGFFICGEPNQSETWASGCTNLIYPEFSGKTIQDTSVKTNVTACNKIKDYFITALLQESNLTGQTNGISVFKNSLSPTIFSSNWLHSTHVITDEAIINRIKNKKIKTSIKINTNCGDLCVLIDHIILDKKITKVTGENIVLTKSPGFKLTKVIDNKKSWVNNTELTDRIFSISDINSTTDIRETEYTVNDERLIINSKEIDLDINIANAIETDFYNYAKNNICLFTGRTEVYNCNEAYYYSKQFQDNYCFQFQDNQPYSFMNDEQIIPSSGYSIANYQDFFDADFDYTFTGDTYLTAKCGDDNLNFISLVSTEIPSINTLKNFNDFMTSEFIDAKNRQTIIGYGTLRALYERYLNSSGYCQTNSNKFDYINVNTFANLLNNYWINIIEQVVPATSIWGNIKVYRNTIFDEQKYKYRSYTSLFKKTDFNGVTAPSPISDTFGMCNPVEVIVTEIPDVGVINTNPKITKYNFINLVQMNSSSEFIGTITIR